MALSLSKDYTFAPNTTISSSEVNTDFDELYNAFSGLEAMTSTLAALKMDADPTTALAVATKQYVDAYAAYRRPDLTYVSATQIDVEVNTATANTTKIIFPDGNYRSVTEDTSSTNKYRRFDITADAEFTSGTEESGLRAALTEATNTWYAIYAVKSTINTANFVLVGDTTLPTIANVSTLNGYYGTNGWVYLGLIRNGDNSGATGDILNFVQAGNRTRFINTVTTGGNTGNGTILATTAGATTLTYTYAAGTGTAQVPNPIKFIDYGITCAGSGTSWEAVTAVATGMRVFRVTGATIGTGSMFIPNMAASQGLKTECQASSAQDILMAGFIDGVLGVGSNPMI